jgi:hypothetical protein
VGLDAPKQLHLIFERDVDGATMAKAVTVHGGIVTDAE